MIITAALPWYDERPEDLEACIAGIANVADKLVALDGSYSRFPNAKVRSPREQVNMIYSAARNVGLDCQVVLPDRLWLGQVEKRTALLQLASQETDWICTVDTDHIIHTDKSAIRAEISKTPRNVAVLDVKYVTPENKEKDLRSSASGEWHIQQTQVQQYLPHVFRSFPEMQVERFHWWYSALVDGKRAWLWRGDHRMTQEQQQYDVVGHKRLEGYTVEHRCLFRDERHILENRAFCNDREMVWRETGQEDDRGWLPRPKFDYTRLPI